MPFSVSTGKITSFYGDAIVIPAHRDLKQCPGVSAEIFKKAGAFRLSRACKKAVGLKYGDAYVTEGFKSDYIFIIHVACLCNEGEMPLSKEILYQCYISGLNAAVERRVQRIGLPVLADYSLYSGIELFHIACTAITDFLRENDVIEVKLFADDSKELFPDYTNEELNEYVRSHWKPESRIRFSLSMISSESDEEPPKPDPFADKKTEIREIDKRLEIKKEYFSDYLIKLIKKRGMSNVDVYTKANISRQQFSRIIGNREYNPQKKTIFAFAVALRLSMDETEELLKKAGHAISDTDKLDVILSYFIEKHIYDIFEINDALLYYGQPLLGSGM